MSGELVVYRRHLIGPEANVEPGQHNVKVAPVLGWEFPLENPVIAGTT